MMNETTSHTLESFSFITAINNTKQDWIFSESFFSAST